MRLLFIGICLRNGGTWFAEPKAQLPEKTLALPCSQINLVLLRNPSSKRFAIP